MTPAVTVRGFTVRAAANAVVVRLVLAAGIGPVEVALEPALARALGHRLFAAAGEADAAARRGAEPGGESGR